MVRTPGVKPTGTAPWRLLPVSVFGPKRTVGLRASLSPCPFATEPSPRRHLLLWACHRHCHRPCCQTPAPRVRMCSHCQPHWALWDRLLSQTAPHSQGTASVCLVLEALAPRVARLCLSAPAFPTRLLPSRPSAGQAAPPAPLPSLWGEHVFSWPCLRPTCVSLAASGCGRATAAGRSRARCASRARGGCWHGGGEGV